MVSPCADSRSFVRSARPEMTAPAGSSWPPGPWASRCLPSVGLHSRGYLRSDDAPGACRGLARLLQTNQPQVQARRVGGTGSARGTPARPLAGGRVPRMHATVSSTWRVPCTSCARNNRAPSQAETAVAASAPSAGRPAAVERLAEELLPGQATEHRPARVHHLVEAPGDLQRVLGVLPEVVRGVDQDAVRADARATARSARPVTVATTSATTSSSRPGAAGCAAGAHRCARRPGPRRSPRPPPALRVGAHPTCR